jgi:putative hydrolase of the HAD superfamily
MIQPNASLDRQGVVAWDFDGVLNRNIEDRRFVWADRFEADIGHSLAGFNAAIFAQGFDEIITGRQDLRDRVEAWALDVGYAGGPDALLTYWFEKDARPDTEVGELMDALAQQGVRQIIVTNNERRRAAYIEREMGFGSRVERVFASGRMGLRKPDPAYFAHVTTALDVDPARMLLIDDCPKNVPAAIRCGWQTFHFTDDTRHALRGALGL